MEWSLRKNWLNYRLPLIFAFASLSLLAISLVLLVQSVPSPSPIEFTRDESTNESLTLTVDVQGAVIKPGVYELPAGSRVEDAINIAGGLSSQADLEKISQTINRATKLIDGGKLYFPKKGEGASVSVSSLSSSSSPSNLVSVNYASQSQLESLSGIGPVTAGKIISNRPYQLLEELVSKKVLSQSLYEKLKAQLTL